jgi:hypothetical protein
LEKIKKEAKLKEKDLHYEAEKKKAEKKKDTLTILHEKNLDLFH